ncbi:MAG: hypothetical protein METHAR1v1_610006 [Methanothrix sp.]|nr:MAG: hypothetical protein METHAR1v1_610006 [Methanothrix sp.]
MSIAKARMRTISGQETENPSGTGIIMAAPRPYPSSPAAPGGSGGS